MAKQGQYYVSVLITVPASLMAAFLGMLLTAATTFSPLVEEWIGFSLYLLANTIAVLALSIREGYEKRTFSLRCNLVNGVVFIAWHGVVSWLSKCAWFVSGLLYSKISSLICLANDIYLMDGEAAPLVLNVMSVLIVDSLFIIPMMAMGNCFGAYKYHREVQEIQKGTKLETSIRRM